MPQYQHFIPQFILRKYSDYKKPKREEFLPKGSEEYDKAIKKAKKKATVSVIGLEKGFDDMKLEARKTKNVCGLNDMYGTEIEEKFGKMEAEASKIISKIEDDFNSGSKTTRLSRPDKDTLRRFLFIMLYRSRTFHERFEKTCEEYDADDKTTLLKYMREKKFKTPREVWLDNFRVFLGVSLGHDSKRWEAELMETTYSEDAKWFIHHMNHFFLCFCKPENYQDEFLLTQNAYGIFEGPNSYAGWTDWHNFAPISPRLLIVLRNIWIDPLPSEPPFDQLRDHFEQFVALNCSIHPNPVTARSWLAGMPAERPQPNYLIKRYVEYARRRARSQELLFSNNDSFDFKLFTPPNSYVQRINSIFLENVPGTLAIAFGTRNALRRALESYLELEMPGLKVVHTVNKAEFEGVLRENAVPSNYDYKKYLLGLESVARSLGSEVKAKYIVKEPEITQLVPSFPANFDKRYRRLGWDELPATWLKDFEQAYLLTVLHSYTERLIKFLGRRIKDQVRENRRNIVDSLHPRRLWLSLRMQKAGKRVPQASTATIEAILQAITGDSCDGPEDAILDDESADSTSAIFRFSSLSKLLMTARDMDGYLEVKKEHRQEVSFWFHARLAYGQIGSILRCGSSLLENAAAVAYGSIVTDPEKQELVSRQATRLSISREQMTELLVRMCLFEEFESVVGTALPAGVRRKLKVLLMEVVYPTKMSSGKLSA